MMGAQDTVKKVSFKDRISNILGTIRMAAGQAPGQGVGFAGFNPEGALHKAVIPEYLYRPPYGYPRMSNIPEIRRLAATPYVAMGVNTIVNEVCGVPWGVYPKDKERADDKKLLARCDEAKQFLENPNVNEESFRDILTMYVTDMIEINTGILNKVYNLKGELKELYAKDGGTFTKNPDIFGTFADRADYVLPTFNINLIQHAGQYDEWMKSVNKEPAYFQYGGTVGVRPMPFGRREIIFTINNSRTNQIYGWSPVEILLDVIQLLVYGITTNLEYYTDNNIPKGVGAIIGANQDQIDAFTKRWKDKMTKKDQVGDIVKKYHEIPFVGQEVKFERIQFSNVELELLEQQKWFTKIAWAMLGVTPGELGFTEDENLAVEKEQSKVFRKKTIRSLLQKITYSLNSQLVWTDFSDEIEFRFDIDNLDDEKEKLEIYEMKLRNDIMTVNEVRHELGLEPLKGGDDMKSSRMQFNPFGNESEFGKEEDKKPFGKKEEKSITVKAKEAMFAGKTKGYSVESPLAPKEGEETLDELDFEKEMKRALKESEARILDILTTYVPRMNVLGEVKAIDKAVMAMIKAAVNLLMGEATVKAIIRKMYYDGVQKAEKELDMNFVPNQRAISFLQDHTFDNIKGMNDELAEDLRQELERGIMANEGISKLKARVKSVFDVSEPRAKAIAQTETNRALNVGHLDGYKQSGIEGKKKWVSVMDGKTSEACARLNGKMVGVNDNFKYKDWEGPCPPQHINCRSRITYIPDGGGG